MAINLSDNININSPKVLDKRYGPWNNITDANTNILSLQRTKGLTVGILSGSGVIEYWYYSGTTDNDLVLKTVDSFNGGVVNGATLFTNGLSANTISATTYLNLPVGNFTGGTVSGNTIFTSGLTASTISAGTYTNLPTYISAVTLSSENVLSVISGGSTATTSTVNAVTGGSYSSGIITLSGTGSVNGTQITGLNTTTPFNGGTVAGATLFTGGLTANTFSATTISATQYNGLPQDVYVTGFTFSQGDYDLRVGRNDGWSETVSLSILATDMTVTGGTYNKNNGVVTFYSNVNNSRTGLYYAGNWSASSAYTASTVVTYTVNDRDYFVISSGVSPNPTPPTGDTLNWLALSGRGVFDVSGFTSGYTDTSISQFLYSPITNTFTLNTSTGGTFTATVTTFSGLTVNGNLSATNLAIGVLSGTNALHVSATTNPVRFQGLTATTADTFVVSVDTDGVLHAYPVSGLSNGSSTTSLKYYAEPSANPTTPPVVSASNSIAIGNGAQALGNDMFVVGEEAGRNSTGTTRSSFIGKNAGLDNIDSTSADFFGDNAGKGTFDIYQSSFIGTEVGTYSSGISDSFFAVNGAGNLASNVEASNFIGPSAGYNVTGVTYSNFLGNRAGYNATNASNSNFIGQSAGDGATNASDSNFMGQNAGDGVIGLEGEGFFSNFIGKNAGYQAINASNSNFIGKSAGQAATNASTSNFLGLEAGTLAEYANNSNFIGTQAGTHATNANGSNFFGDSAGYYAENANNSNFIGNQAGYEATGASYSTLIGYFVGKKFNDNNIGSNNIIIGKNISLPDSTTNSINIGGVLFGTGTHSNVGDNPSVIANADGRIGIGVVSPTNTLHINGTADPVRFQGLTATTADTFVVSIDTDGVLHAYPVSGLTGSASTASLKYYAEPSANPTTPPVVSASNSIAIGSDAQALDENMFVVGQLAGSGTNSSRYSNFIGASAGQAASNAELSNFIGNNAGYLATASTNSNFIGNGAGSYSPDVINSNFIGTNAGNGASAVTYSNFIGNSAGQNVVFTDNTVNSNLNFIGNQAGASASAITGTTLIGTSAGAASNTTRYGNIIGYEAGSSSSNNKFFNFIGYQAGSGVTGSDYSEYIGYRAGYGNKNSFNSVLIGTDAGSRSTGLTNSVVIGFNGVLSAGTDNLVELPGYTNTNLPFNLQFPAGAGLVAIGTYAAIQPFVPVTGTTNLGTISRSIFMGYAAGAFISGSSINAVVIGEQAASNSKTLSSSVIIGNLAYKNNNTQATSAVIIGASAGFQTQQYSAQTGSSLANTVAIGVNAAKDLSGTSTNSVFIGNSAGSNTNSAAGSVYIGSNAGINGFTLSSSIGIGLSAGARNYAPTSSIYIGNSAGADSSISGSVSTNVIFIGSSAGIDATNAVNSIFVGGNAGQNASGSSTSIIVGQSAGINSTGITTSIIMGSESGRSIVSGGADMILIGRRAGYLITGGTESILIGYQTGRASNLGAKNIIIGYNITLPVSSANRMNIGGVIFGSNTSATAGGTPSSAATTTGMIGIGVEIPTARLTLPAATTTQASLRLISGSTAPSSPNNGDIWIQNNDLRIRLSGVTKTVQVDPFTASSSTFTGGTVNGATIFNSGLTANTLNVTGNTRLASVTANTLTITGNTLLSGLTATTISATTYQNLPKDVFVTGGTYSASVSTLIFTNNTGGTFNVGGITSSATFTGGTVSGPTVFNSGLTANTLNVINNALLSGLTATTISATTYRNLPTYISATTLSGNVLSVTSGNSTALTYTINAVTGGTYNSTTGTITLSGTGSVNGNTITGLTATSGNILFNTNNSSTYTLQLSDANNVVVEMTSTTSNTITVPPSGTTNFVNGVQISVVQNGTGQTSILAGGGVTILSAGGALKLRAQYSFATLIKKSGDTWYLSGDISV